MKQILEVQTLLTSFFGNEPKLTPTDVEMSYVVDKVPDGFDEFVTKNELCADVHSTYEAIIFDTDSNIVSKVQYCKDDVDAVMKFSSNTEPNDAIAALSEALKSRLATLNHPEYTFTIKETTQISFLASKQ